MRIAILDDDPAWLELARNVLGRAGHCCDLFRRGRELLALMRRETRDLVISGTNVRDMPGDEVLRWLRGHCHASLPVLSVTARATTTAWSGRSIPKSWWQRFQPCCAGPAPGRRRHQDLSTGILCST
jgi:DNA-binding NtrC family response regulator